MLVTKLYNRFALYYYTIKYMRLSQIMYMLLKPYFIKKVYRFHKRNFGRLSETIKKLNIIIPEIDDDDQVYKDFSYEDIENNTFTFLNETNRVNLNTWHTNADPLWVFNLHYFEYAKALGHFWKKTKDDKYYIKYVELLSSWISSNKEDSLAWHPYPMSLRLINLIVSCQLFEKKLTEDNTFYIRLVGNIYKQYRTLILRQEKWLSANHYFENIFTIVVCSFFFRENRILIKYLNKLKKEISVQIMEDGMHYELSPTYQKVLFVDLLRLKQLSSDVDFPNIAWIDDILIKMYSAISFMEESLNRAPLFNDSGTNVAVNYNIIKKLYNRVGLRRYRTSCLGQAGYYKLKNELICLMIDAGIIGPDSIPGHGHCDCLSFEVFINGEAVFVNSGTYKYQGDKREYFRSTRAHNTVMIDGNEQSQCWGQHRVAKRIKNVRGGLNKNVFEGEYKNFLGQKHQRIIKLGNRVVQVKDRISPNSKGKSFLHISPNYYIRDNLEILQDNVLVAKINPRKCPYVIYRDGELSQYAESFGKIEKGSCIVFSYDSNINGEYGYDIYINV